MTRLERGTALAALGAAGLLLAGCSHAQEPAIVRNDKPAVKHVNAASPHIDNGRFKTGAGEAHVGFLIANVDGSMAAPSHYCLEDGSRYKGAAYRLGRINVFVPQGAVPSQALNGPAIVYGRRQTGLEGKVTRIGPCPPADNKPTPQLRSDWVAPEADWRGRTTKARLAGTHYIEATAVYPLPLIEARRAGADTLHLVLTNPFDRPLGSSATFSLYYEGGPKKPMGSFEAQSLDDLAPGAAKTFVVTLPAKPTAHRKPGRGHRSFRGYQISGRIGDVRLELLVSLPIPN